MTEHRVENRVLVAEVNHLNKELDSTKKDLKTTKQKAVNKILKNQTVKEDVKVAIANSKVLEQAERVKIEKEKIPEKRGHNYKMMQQKQKHDLNLEAKAKAHALKAEAAKKEKEQSQKRLAEMGSTFKKGCGLFTIGQRVKGKGTPIKGTRKRKPVS